MEAEREKERIEYAILAYHCPQAVPFFSFNISKGGSGELRRLVLRLTDSLLFLCNSFQLLQLIKIFL
jgi:hypothetical protein